MSEATNRAFLYGESVFTTMRMINGQRIEWSSHFDRLKQGVEFVYGPFTDGDQWFMTLKNRIQDRLANESGDRIVRITIYLEGVRGVLNKGLISVADLKIDISSSIFEPERFEGKMLKLRTCAAFARPAWWPSYLKAGNYLETILAQKVSLKAGDDDLLFLSTKNTVLESSVANIFIVRHNKLFTAPVGPNVLSGVTRKKVIQIAAEFFEEMSESETTVEQLYKADAVFGSNSVRGLFLVDRIDDHELNYSQEFLNKFELMRKRVLA